MQDSQKRGSEGKSCCVPKRLKTTIMEDKIQEEESVLPGSQTADSLSIDSSESYSTRMAALMAKMASAMEKLAAENAILRNRLHKMEKLAAENAKDINDKLAILLAFAEKTWSGVEKLQRDTKTLISHAEKTAAGVKQIVSGRM